MQTTGLTRSRSLAASLAQEVKDNPAAVLFAAFLFSVYFLNGAVSNAVAFATFGIAWWLIGRGARDGEMALPWIAPIALLFLAVVSLRLLLPPYGDPQAVPGAALARSVLLVGLFGLTFYVYARLPFDKFLWLIAAMAFACCLIVIAIEGYDLHLPRRLQFMGRASHPIFGAGAIAAGLIAAFSLLFYRPLPRKWSTSAILVGMLLLLAAAIYFSGSRGPIISLLITLVAAPVVVALNFRWLYIAVPFATWAVLTSTVLLEPVIKSALCPAIAFACRKSSRHDVWVASLNKIAEHPLWGSGYGFRFEGVPHAHNAYLGIALNFGLPILLLFIALMATALAGIHKIDSKQTRFYLIATLIFANGFMGSDLSDPLRFFNTHYVFLWIPLFIALIAPQMQVLKVSENAAIIRA